MKSSVLFECGPLPPMSTSRPPDVFHLISIPRPSPYFAALSLSCIIEQKMGEAWERGCIQNMYTFQCQDSLQEVLCGQITIITV